jgi:hypothetical protein
LRSRIAPARSRSFRASGFERTGRHRKQRNPSRPQHNQSPAQQNPSRGQQNPNPAQQNPNACSFRQPRLFNRLPPIPGRAHPPRPEAPRSGLEGRPVRRGARAGLWSILRDAPSTLLRMRRWLAPRQSPPRRRSFRFLKSKPEFAFLARKCLFFRRSPFVSESARRQPALCQSGQSWPGSALFDRRKLQRPNSLDVHGDDRFGRGFLPFRWSPGKGGNPALIGRHRRAVVWRKSTLCGNDASRAHLRQSRGLSCWRGQVKAAFSGRNTHSTS